MMQYGWMWDVIWGKARTSPADKIVIVSGVGRGMLLPILLCL